MVYRPPHLVISLYLCPDQSGSVCALPLTEQTGLRTAALPIGWLARSANRLGSGGLREGQRGPVTQKRAWCSLPHMCLLRGGGRVVRVDDPSITVSTVDS